MLGVKAARMAPSLRSLPCPAAQFSAVPPEAQFCWQSNWQFPFLRDVFLMIRRHKTTIFTDAKESSTVFELKRIVEGILKRPPDEQRLYKDDQLLDDGKTLGECGFTSQTARPQAPATVGLAFRADEAFEALRIEPFSSPPELPDVMKPQDSGSSANEQAVQ
uniref:elongin-B n=1 Tax=Nyctereutes procyonoides TaxID=34880 RepID=UPI002443BA1C|nr:elongin-B [Nyctereutes procyonoides]